MTPIEQLAQLAIDIGRAAPMKRGQYVHSAQIPWHYIEDIRKVMSECGVALR